MLWAGGIAVMKGGGKKKSPGCHDLVQSPEATELHPWVPRASYKDHQTVAGGLGKTV